LSFIPADVIDINGLNHVEQKKLILSSSAESTGIEPEIDLPEIIGDEWADPEEFLNDFCSDDVEAAIEARKHFNSPLF
jgi:hypothetical protein